MTATSISMPESEIRAFVPGIYAVVDATNEHYALFSRERIPQPLPAWQEHVIGRLAQLERLAPNWDSDGALPVSRQHANRAQRFLAGVMGPMSPEPEIVPLADGGVQLEWRLGGNVRIDFVTDEDEPGGVVLIEVDGELLTLPASGAMQDVRERLGNAALAER